MRNVFFGFSFAVVMGGLSLGGAVAQEMGAELGYVLEAVYKANPDKAAFCAKGSEGWKQALSGPASEFAGGGKGRPEKIRDLVRTGVLQIAKDCGADK